MVPKRDIQAKRLQLLRGSPNMKEPYKSLTKPLKSPRNFINLIFEYFSTKLIGNLFGWFLQHLATPLTWDQSWQYFNDFLPVHEIREQKII